jgi:hypothetical protein
MLIKINKANDAPLIEVPQARIEESMRGANVCDVEIQMEDGTYCRFFVTAQLKGGRPSLEVSTNTKDGSRSKKVTGIKRPNGFVPNIR